MERGSRLGNVDILARISFSYSILESTTAQESAACWWLADLELEAACWTPGRGHEAVCWFTGRFITIQNRLLDLIGGFDRFDCLRGTCNVGALFWHACQCGECSVQTVLCADNAQRRQQIS